MASEEKIGAKQVVEIHYTLRDENGETIDSSREAEPLSYLHGEGQIVPGLEQALDGKAVGEEVRLTVKPEDGYGARDPQRIFDVPRDQFDFEVTPGDTVHAQMPNGAMVPLQIVEVGEEKVKVDGNHPLAGKILDFEVEVMSIRPATAEELSHGHAHGPGHDHH